jgi:hypothetical protein
VVGSILNIDPDPYPNEVRLGLVFDFVSTGC